MQIIDFGVTNSAFHVLPQEEVTGCKIWGFGGGPWNGVTAADLPTCGIVVWDLVIGVQ
jgi:hypothetical protein